MSDLVERFWAKVEKTDTCWLWTARTSRGYGKFWTPEREVQAYRFSYELAVGAIPDGLVLDHLCRVRSCVNPEHLEPVTNRENVLRGIGLSAENARKTTCHKGHPLTPENYYIQPSRPGGRQCRACRLELRPTPDERNVTFVCPHCGKTRAAAHRVRHMRTMHPEVAA